MRRLAFPMQSRPIEGLATAFRDTYRTSFVLFGTAVGLWAGAAAVELVQHAVEWELGLFAADASIEAALESNTYHAAAWAKVAAVTLGGWLVPRYLYQERDWRRVLRPDGTLARGIAVMAAVSGLPNRSLRSRMPELGTSGSVGAGGG